MHEFFWRGGGKREMFSLCILTQYTKRIVILAIAAIVRRLTFLAAGS